LNIFINNKKYIIKMNRIDMMNVHYKFNILKLTY
jgi:hypothetical protein